MIGIFIGFLFGTLISAIWFELFSIKHPKTKEEAEQVLALIPKTESPIEYTSALVEHWKTD